MCMLMMAENKYRVLASVGNPSHNLINTYTLSDCTYKQQYLLVPAGSLPVFTVTRKVTYHFERHSCQPAGFLLVWLCSSTQAGKVNHYYSKNRV